MVPCLGYFTSQAAGHGHRAVESVGDPQSWAERMPGLGCGKASLCPLCLVSLGPELPRQV